MEGHNVLSLFDGISCGAEAFRMAQIPICKYIASEIDKYAISISRKNHPNIIHIGDVEKIDFNNYKDCDSIIAGSPCQGFSTAGKMKNFEDERSGLIEYFFKAIKIIKPKYFLLENVVMKNEWADKISDRLGIDFQKIDSSCFSPQKRMRLYWVAKLNSEGNYEQIKIEYPCEKNSAVLQDILKSGIAFSPCKDGKSRTLIASYAKTVDKNWYKRIWRKRYDPNKQLLDYIIEPSEDGQIKIKNGLCYVDEMTFDMVNENGYIPDVPNGSYNIRTLSNQEMEILQGLPMGYTDESSNARKAIGNGWQVNTIAYIFSQMFNC